MNSRSYKYIIIGGGLAGKAEEIAEADGGAGDGHDHADLGAPVLSRRAAVFVRRRVLRQRSSPSEAGQLARSVMTHGGRCWRTVQFC